MRIPAWIVAPLTALSVFVLSPAARADGFYVTFSDGVSIARTKGAAFDSTSAAPVSYSSSSSHSARFSTALHVELDDYNQALALADAIDRVKTFSVSIDLTTPNSAGVETTYLTLKYTNAQLASVKLTYAAGSPAVFTESMDILYEAVATSTPPAAVAVAKTAPTRLVRGPLLVPSVAIVKIAPVLGASASTLTNANLVIGGSPGWALPGVAITSFSTSVAQPHDAHSGLATGHAVRAAIAFSKSPAPPSLVASVSKPFTDVVFNFVNHSASGGDTILLSLKSPQMILTSDTVQASGGAATEQGSFTSTTYSVVQGSSSASF